MITLDIPPQTAQIIAQVAEQKGQSLHDFILISAYEKALTLNSGMVQTPAIGLGDRIHQIFAQANYPDLEIPERTAYPREIEL